MESYIKDLEFSGYNADQINQIILAANKGFDLTAFFNPETDVTEMRAFRQRYNKCSPEKLNLIGYAKKKKLDLDYMQLIDKFNYPTIDLIIKLTELGSETDFITENLNKTQAKKVFELLDNEDPYFCNKVMFSNKRRSKDYDLYLDFKSRKIPIEKLLNKGYSFEQLEILDKYMNKWIDLTQICKPEHPIALYKFLGEIISDLREDTYRSLQITEDQLVGLVKAGYNYKQIKELYYAIEADLDYEKMLNKEYNSHQMSVIGLGLYHDIDVDIYANPKWDAEQMDVIRFVTERMARKRIPDNPYNYFEYGMIINSKNYTAKEMKEVIDLFDYISRQIEDKKDLIKMFYSNSIEELKAIKRKYAEKEIKKGIDEYLR